MVNRTVLVGTDGKVQDSDLPDRLSTATLTQQFAAKASIPANGRTAVVFNSASSTDARPTTDTAKTSVIWVTTYTTAPVNLVTDVDLWFGPVA